MTDILARVKARHVRVQPFGQCGECHVTWPCRTWLDLETVEERDAREAADQAAYEAHMNDPIAQIREAVTGEDVYDSVEQMAAAILVVLELHPPTVEVEQEDVYDTAGAFVMSRTRQVRRHDPTIRAIAKELRIEMPDA